MAKPLYQKEIPASDPRNPQPVDFTLHYDTPKEVEGKFGPQYLYTGTYEGGERTLYAGGGLHRAIQEAGGGGKGATLSILRTGEGKDTRWSVLVDGTLSEEQADSGPDPFITGDARLPKPSPDSRTRFINNLKRYKIAFKKAVDFRDDTNEVIDLNAVAFTFYKMASDAGFDLLELEEDSGNE